MRVFRRNVTGIHRRADFFNYHPTVTLMDAKLLLTTSQLSVPLPNYSGYTQSGHEYTTTYG